MQRPMATPSPCTGECRVGTQGICRGCGRTLEEIAAWSTASEDQRAAIVKAAAARRPDGRSGEPVAQQS
ncbi:MAG TPA: DUF1289 domain-containing protein [Roseococcus sp.]|nr:DUF1289 domain-containing protein [Roseococcus sp.]